MFFREKKKTIMSPVAFTETRLPQYFIELKKYILLVQIIPLLVRVLSDCTQEAKKVCISNTDNLIHGGLFLSNKFKL